MLRSEDSGRGEEDHDVWTNWWVGGSRGMNGEASSDVGLSIY